MAKFISHDGTDKNGIRAEVTVQTGTGVISEITGRGKQKEDGSYRNVEVVFDPDNPMLKRKVYGLLDTTSTELWNLIQEAHKNNTTVSYRIESQRRNGVDRETPIGELNATEQIRRILAGVDGVFSHEAKTNPIEDPSNENPSALTQTPEALAGSAAAAHTPAANAVGAAGAAVNAGNVVNAISAEAATATLGAAIAHALPTPVIAAAAATALTAGASPETISEQLRHHPIADANTALFTADGGINYSSPAIDVACQAEQFALDHLIRLYTPARATTPITVTDEVIAQAAAVAIELLTITDDVLADVTGSAPVSRQTAAFQRAFSIVRDSVDRRHPAPIGGSDNDKAAWRANITEESRDRMVALGDIVRNTLPSTSPAAAPEVPEVPEATPAEAPEAAVETAETGTPASTAPEFTKPDTALVERVKTLCANANVTDQPRLISDWLERKLGARIVSEINAPDLAAFCDKYETAGPAVVAAEVLNQQPTLV